MDSRVGEFAVVHGPAPVAVQTDQDLVNNAHRHGDAQPQERVLDLGARQLPAPVKVDELKGLSSDRQWKRIVRQ